jgi:hypothetical protein
MEEAHAAERDIASTRRSHRAIDDSCARVRTRQGRQGSVVLSPCEEHSLVCEMTGKSQTIQGWLAHTRFGQAIATVARSRLRDEDRTVGIETCALRLGEQSFVVWDYGGQYEVCLETQSLEV